METTLEKTELYFNSKYEHVKKVEQSFPESEIKKETMLFSSDIDFARRNGDALTNLFIENMPEDWQNSKLVIDSRVHMLMKGWAPCIPGWHHDDVPRNGRMGQPNYINPEYYAEHLMMLVNASVAPTEFLYDEINLDLPEEGKVIYSEWNKEINKTFNIDSFSIKQIEDSMITRFDWQTFHRCPAAVKNGWRFFIRASRYWNDKEMTTPNESRFQRRTGKNEIRRQVQVYLPDYEKGW